MQIEERRQADIVVLRPVGRIDNVSSADFQERLLATVASDVKACIVDLSAVPYIASYGMRAIIATARATPSERRFAVAAPGTVVAEVFRVARLSHVVPVFDTVAEAEAAVSQAG